MNDIKHIIFSYLPENHYEIITKVMKFRYYNVPPCDYTDSILNSCKTGMFLAYLEENLIKVQLILNIILTDCIEYDDLHMFRDNNIFDSFFRRNIINILIENNDFNRLIVYQNILEKIIIYADFKKMFIPNILFLSKNNKFYHFKKSKSNIFYRKYINVYEDSRI